MKPIKEIKLGDLVKEVSEDLVAQKRKSAAGLIKGFLQKQETLAEEINKLEKELARKIKSLEDTKVIVDKIKGGDWSLLQETGGNASENKKEEVKTVMSDFTTK